MSFIGIKTRNNSQYFSIIFNNLCEEEQRTTS